MRLMKMINRIHLKLSYQVYFGYDQDFNEDIANINGKLQRHCNSKGLSLIDNNNIDRSKKITLSK